MSARSTASVGIIWFFGGFLFGVFYLFLLLPGSHLLQDLFLYLMAFGFCQALPIYLSALYDFLDISTTQSHRHSYLPRYRVP